jgi:cytochrome c peroxidase
MTLSDAYPGTQHFRNAPTLLNTFYKTDFTDVGWGWDGRMGANLDDVIRDQISDSVIMNMDMRLMQERMKQDPVYVGMCAGFFDGECSSGQARKALLSLLKRLVSGDTPFDSGELSPSANQGRALFEGKAECIRCHNGPYFSDGKPHNTGVPENLELFRNPLRHIAFRAVMTNHGLPKPDIWRRDVGYFLVSKRYADVGKFITPTLRELKYTAPYMHNGVFDTLEEVVLFYNRGGGHDDPLADALPTLGLTEDEQKNLLAFLESLSSRSPVTLEQVKTPDGYEPTSNWLEVNN